MFESDVNMGNFRLPEADIFDVYIAPGGEFAWAVIEQRVFIGDVKIGHSWYIVVYRKIDGKWLVNAAIDADLPPKD